VGLLVWAGLAAGALFDPSPASAVGPYPGLGSCSVFPDPPASLPANAASLPSQAAWNQDVSKAPVARGSAATIAYINANGGDRLHPDFGSPRAYGFPYAVVGAGQRRLPIRYTAYGQESDPGPFPIPKGAPVEGGKSSDGDRHMLVVDRSSCTLYELYRAFFKGGPARWNADSGTRWDLRSTELRPDSWTSADAAGLPIFPGLVRYDEIAAGRVDHAIRVTFESTRDAWVHPASHCAGDTSNASAPAMGTRLRLKAGYGLGGFSGGARTIAEALKRYGMIVADNGSNWFFSGTSDRRWDDENHRIVGRDPLAADEDDLGRRIALQLVFDGLHEVLVSNPGLGLDTSPCQRGDRDHEALLRLVAGALHVGGPAVEEADPRRREHPHLLVSRRADVRNAGDPGHVGRVLDARGDDDQHMPSRHHAGGHADRVGGSQPRRDDEQAEHSQSAERHPERRPGEQKAGDDRHREGSDDQWQLPGLHRTKVGSRREPRERRASRRGSAPRRTRPRLVASRAAAAGASPARSG
jgi:hypothetical protein